MSTRVFSERLLLLALLSTAGAGCQRPRESPEAYAARVVVQRYNQLLPEAFRASRGDLLAEVAGPAEVSRVSSVIAGLSSQGKYMEARQLEFTPVGALGGRERHGRAGVTGSGRLEVMADIHPRALTSAHSHDLHALMVTHLPPSGH